MSTTTLPTGRSHPCMLPAAPLLCVLLLPSVAKIDGASVKCVVKTLLHEKRCNKFCLSGTSKCQRDMHPVFKYHLGMCVGSMRPLSTRKKCCTR